MGGRMGIPELAAYNATKWGVIGLAKSVALEVAKEGITVNVICPTMVRTPMVQPKGGDDVPDDLVRRMMKANPIPQLWLAPEDVSGGLLYLVTDPGVVTGSVLEIGLGGSSNSLTITSLPLAARAARYPRLADCRANRVVARAGLHSTLTRQFRLERRCQAETLGLC
jgi:hypothetical protein